MCVSPIKIVKDEAVQYTTSSLLKNKQLNVKENVITGLKRREKGKERKCRCYKFAYAAAISLFQLDQVDH